MTRFPKISPETPLKTSLETWRPAATALLLAAATALGTPASAGEAEIRHGSWRACLDRAFVVQAALTGRDLAADQALRDCRAAEDAYLEALSASPLLDEADLARARPALAARARGRLIRPRAALR